MKFEGVRYLEWAKLNITHPSKYDIDLANSAVSTPSLAELGVRMEDMELTTGGNCSFGLPALIDAIASAYKVSYKNVVTTPGTNMAIFLVLSALLEPGDEILLETPNYEPLYRSAQYLEASIRTIERSFENEFQIDLEQIQRKISKRTRAIILTNLHNPSGAAIGMEKLRTIGQIARHYNAYVVCDEVYKDMVFEGAPPPPAFTLGENMITMSSFSKIYGLGALRSGWILCSEAVQSRIRKIENYFLGSTPLPSEKLLLAAFNKREELLNRSRNILLPNFDILKNWMEQRDDIRCVIPDGGTVCFPKLPRSIDSLSFIKLLSEKYGTIAVPGDFFWAKGFFRLSFCSSQNNLKEGLANIEKALAEMQMRR